MTNPNQTSSTSNTAQEVVAVMSGVQGLARGLVEAFNAGAVATGQARSEQLTQPLTGTFGTFDKKRIYTEGCVVSRELSGTVGKRVGELSFRLTRDNKTTRQVVIGPTPAAYDSRKGGEDFADAGNPGDYLLAIVEKTSDSVITTTMRYLDQVDIADIAIVNGASNLTLGENPDRARQLKLPGEISHVVGLTNE